VIAAGLPAGAGEIAASVSERDYLRLLGLPRGRALEGDLLERVAGARAWYARHGRPFVAWRQVGVREIATDSVLPSEGGPLTSRVLADRLRSGEAHALVALCASAGAEGAVETRRLWAADQPDEAFFLDRFAVAVTERVLFWAAGEICRAAEPARETLLPHLSPGCGQWDLADQHRLMALLTGDSGPGLGPVELLSSGALYPQHSVLAAFGVTRHQVKTSPEDLCRACDLAPCAFRRVPRARESSAWLQVS
jgi:hypothetical protein